VHQLGHRYKAAIATSPCSPSASVELHWVDVARAQIGDDACELEWAVGRKMTLDEAAAYARANASTARARGPLTQRELQILRLVADGNTNRDVATTLVISDGAVKRHLDNIFAKLGVSSRAAATAAALRSGIT
jgi:DNA-binding NarL/FixJ family response regulator